MGANKRAGRILFVAACVGLLCAGFANGVAAAEPINIVAIGGSNTAGWGVDSKSAYPAQLEAMLKAKGYDVHVANAGVSFATTAGMLRRLDSTVPAGTSIVILQPGGNDVRFFGSIQQRTANIATIARQLRARGIKVIVMENSVVPVDEYQWDGIHFTAEGHAVFASHLMQRVIALIQPH
jgi:acyl-CoA thioesterase-1